MTAESSLFIAITSSGRSILAQRADRSKRADIYKGILGQRSPYNESTELLNYSHRTPQAKRSSDMSLKQNLRTVRTEG